jgi:hypothetical protein
MPEPRPGTWGPRYSLEGRTSAADGNRATLTLDLATEDGSRLRLFARFDDAELRDASATLVMGTTQAPLDLSAMRFEADADEQGTGRGAAKIDSDPNGPSDPLRF